MVCADIRPRFHFLLFWHVGSPAVQFEEPDLSLGDVGQICTLHPIQHGGEARGRAPKAAGSRGDWEVREGRASGQGGMLGTVSEGGSVWDTPALPGTG